MKRYLEEQIKQDLSRKMLLLAGPRQSGKTTIALNIIDESFDRYINWDTDEGREKILKKSFPTEPGYLVLDEIHKFPRWRNLLKGLYDARKKDLQILVTGSARLDHYCKGGDSLQGRYHLLRLHPLSLREVGQKEQKSLDKLLALGPFPEPFLAGDETEARRWSREYRSRVINEDLADLEKVSELSLLELLALKLSESAGSVLSLNSLRKDLEVSHQTVKRWLTILENLYHIYRICPISSTKIKTAKKASKYYFFDWNAVNHPSAKFENLVASHLLKWCHYIEDTQGYSMELRFYRDLEQREVDFVITKNGKPIEFIECKNSVRSIDPNLIYLKKKFPEVKAVQISLESTDDMIFHEHDIRRCSALDYLWDKI
jgi:predicted AAA+ superfamily ATPase